MHRPLVLSLVLVALVGGNLAAEERLRDFHILGIGVNEYADKRVVDLRKAVADVVQLTHYLADQDFDSNRPSRKPRILRDEEATKARIEEELNRLSDWVADGSTVAVVFSGHGTSTDEDWLLSPHDADLDRFTESQVTGATIIRAIDGLIARRRCRVLLVLEACHSGKILEAAQPVFEKYRNPDQGGLILVASCLPKQSGLETKAGDIFNAALMAGLQMMMAHTQPTESVSIGEIRAYLECELTNWLRFFVTRCPGFAWPEQCCLVKCSRSISDDLGLTWASSKLVLPAPVKSPNDWGPSPRMTAITTEASPVGTWRCVRPYVIEYRGNSFEPKAVLATENGEVVTSTVVLDLREDGTYRVTYRSFSGEVTADGGKYRFQSGVGLSLTFRNGTDYFSVDSLDADQLVLNDPALTLGPELMSAINLSVSDRNPVWEFRRIRD